MRNLTLALHMLVLGFTLGCTAKKPQPATHLGPVAAAKPSQNPEVPTPVSVAPPARPKPVEVRRPTFESASKARIENGYVTIAWPTGKKALFQLAALTEHEQALLTALAQASPLVKGNNTVATYRPTVAKRITILKNETTGAVETVELIQPSIIHDQGQSPTCQFQALGHMLQIAGYFVDVDQLIAYDRIHLKPGPQTETLQRLTTGEFGFGTDASLAEQAIAAAARRVPEARYHTTSWTETTLQRQQEALTRSTHSTYLRAKVSMLIQADNWEWVRAELRAGRPVLGALVSDYWRVLPPAYFEMHRAPAIASGHAIVIIGFTWDAAQKTGTFKLVNSWQDQSDITTTTADAKDSLYGCFSVSPKGAAD